MKLNALILFLLIVNSLNGQNNLPDCYDSTKVKRHFSFGTRRLGIGFGSFKKYNGLTLSVTNRTCQLNGVSLTALSGHKSNVNGLNLGLATGCPVINGININIVASEDSIVNGLNIGLFAAVAKKMNGISIGLEVVKSNEANGICISTAEIGGKVTGLSIGILMNVSEESTGLIVSGFSCVSKRKIRGVQIAPINTVREEASGVQFGLYNKAKKISGVQIGLINVIKENRKIFRVLPFINFHFKKKTDAQINRLSLLK